METTSRLALVHMLLGRFSALMKHIHTTALPESDRNFVAQSIWSDVVAATVALYTNLMQPINQSLSQQRLSKEVSKYKC